MRTWAIADAAGCLPDTVREAPRVNSAQVIALNTVNPLGGRGGSLDSDECAALVRQLAANRTGAIIVATRHRSSDLTNRLSAPGSAPRVLGPEVLSILLAHPNVVGWVAGFHHRPMITRHGSPTVRLWEVTPSAMGSRWPRITKHLRREER